MEAIVSSPAEEPLVFEPRPDRPAPPTTVGPIGWLRRNLFGGIVNTLLTLGAVALLAWTVPKLLSWAIVGAVWSGGQEGCMACREGA